MDTRDEGLKALSEMFSPYAADFLDNKAKTAFGGKIVEWSIGAYGAVWARPGLDRRTRSLITLGMLIAQGSEKEFRAHLQVAVKNGCSEAEIEELLYHASVYAGLSAANVARDIAAEVLNKAEPVPDAASAGAR